MKPVRIGDILVRQGKATEAQIDEAVKRQHGTRRFLGDVLVELGYVSDDDVGRALSEQLDIPFVALDDDFSMEPEEVGLIPQSVARKFCMVPVKKARDQAVTLIMRDPLDIEAIDTVRSLTHMEVRKAVSTEERIKAVIDRYYSEDAYIERNLQDLVDAEEEEGARLVSVSDIDDDRLRVLANDAPVVRFVNLLLMQAVRDRASDIHFEPGERKVSVRLRIDGVLREATPPPKSLYQAVVTRIKILSDMDIAERRLPLDGRFKFTAHGRIIDIRVSSLPEVHGEKLVLRVLDRSSLLVDLESVGFEEEMLGRFRRVLRTPHGIILLTGPTGSGKTTTLYGALNYLKSPEKNIQTVEDPVEYLISGINQMPIRPGIGLDFANALRSILRQDPDIIMIGEIRDVETARIAMRAALTGHLVLSTLHTNDAASAFWRLRDIGIESYLVAATINLIIAQRLVRIICEECKRTMESTPELVQLVAPMFPDASSWEYHEGAGCPRCGQTGYYGRTAIYEFLEATDPVREMVLSGAGQIAFRQRAVELGMETLQASGFKKVRRGITTVEEVLSVCPLEAVV